MADEGWAVAEPREEFIERFTDFAEAIPEWKVLRFAASTAGEGYTVPLHFSWIHL